MNGRLLIDAVVQQVTVLIAQLATSGGVRAPVAHIANQVFVQLARELEGQGVSRKVSADMFGMALRAYQRKLRRLTEAATDPGSTLWRAALEFIRSAPLVTRLQQCERFPRDDERQLLAVVHDLIEGGLVFRSGSGSQAVYRAATEAELGELSRLDSERGLDEWLWVVVYREGPIGEAALSERVQRPRAELSAPLERLIDEGRNTASASCDDLGASVECTSSTIRIRRGRRRPASASSMQARGRSIFSPAPWAARAASRWSRCLATAVTSPPSPTRATSTARRRWRRDGPWRARGRRASRVARSIPAAGRPY